MTSPSVPTPINVVIRSRRRDARLSQEALAERLGVTARQVKRWEAGENAPAPENADRLSQVLGGDPLDYAPTFEPFDIVSDEDRRFWDDLFVAQMPLDEVAVKWGLPDPEAVIERRRRIAAEVARHPLSQAYGRQRFEALQATLDAIREREAEAASRSIEDRLAALEAKVDAMAQATAESLAALASAIDELSARTRRGAPGSRRRDAAG